MVFPNCTYVEDYHYLLNEGGYILGYKISHGVGVYDIKIKQWAKHFLKNSEIKLMKPSMYLNLV